MTQFLNPNIKGSRSVIVSEQYYNDVMQSAANYNARLCVERRLRLPFLDSQTGVAQNHTNLWIPYRYRGPGRSHGQLYSYPARRWRKKCHLPLPDLLLPRMKSMEMETAEADMHPISAVENTTGPAAGIVGSVMVPPDAESGEVTFEEAMGAPSVPAPGVVGFRDEYYGEWERLSETPDAGEVDRRNSDSSDYEETYVKKKSKKKETKKRGGSSREGGGSGRGGGGGGEGGGGRGRKKDKELVETTSTGSADKQEKQYTCDTCGMRYKSRPGFAYHLSHSHNKSISQSPSVHDNPPEPLPPPPPPPSPKIIPAPVATHEATKKSSKELKSSSGSSSTRYCDFCLGDESENKKTGTREDMVSCADCGRSGHPSCLQFTPNMIISVKKYPWQCIECKSCGLCGTSDNDDQLLFCDDCDRGYHMYCLKPPLSEPPEGSWSCHLCIVEFYGEDKAGMSAISATAPAAAATE